MVDRSQYDKLLIAERGKWDMVDYTPVQCGVCSFCGTRSHMGYHIRNREDGRVLLVGTSCVFTLCNLSHYQKLAIKRQQALLKNEEKHAALIAEIKAAHEFVTLAQYNNWDDENGVCQLPSQYMGKSDKERIEAARRTVICKLHGRRQEPVETCPACIGAAIIYKATQTTKVHPFWIEQYRKLTEAKL